MTDTTTYQAGDETGWVRGPNESEEDFNARVAASPTVGDPAKGEERGTFTFGGRKRKDGDPFPKIERACIFGNLPIESQAFLIRYGIRQYLSDGAASAKTKEDFEAGIDARLQNLVDADFTRNAGDGPTATDDPEVLANAIAREEVGAAIKAAKATVTKEQRAAAVATYRAAHAERLFAEATKRIADRKANGGGVDLAALGITL